MSKNSDLLFLLLLLFFFLFFSPISSAPQTLGLDSFISNQRRLDHAGLNDTFQSLPSSLKRSLSSAPPSTSTSVISSLLSFQISIPLYIKLVGPFSRSSAATLQSLITSTISSSRFTLLSSPHFFAASHSISVIPSISPQLISILSNALKSHLDSSPSPLHGAALHAVPYTVTDRIIGEDFLRDSASSPPGFYLYLLNLESLGKPYGYSYESRDSSPAFAKCLGSLYASSERYAWIDLGAGPVDYGPALSGDGLLPRGDFHPLSSLHGRPKSERAFLSDLAALVLGAYRTLIVPSLRIQSFHDSTLTVQFVHIHGPDAPIDTGLDWNLIEKTLVESGLLFSDQSLRFRKFSTKFSECPICSFAIAKSTNSYTSRFLFENYTLIVSEYLDSKRMHQILLDSGDEIRKSAGIPESEDYRVVPVYVFDLDYDRLLLLDRFHQAVAFRDMVIALRTKSSQTVSDYSCNGRHIITQTRNLERPIIGSVLQSMWGVSPTHLSWSLEHNSTEVDYTWSVGQTPFGPFSEMLSLSFAQKDAAKRNIILTTLNSSITSAIDVLESLAGHGGDRLLLRHNRYAEYAQRWNLFKYKLDKAVSAVSHLDYEKALYFLRSADHDIYAIHSLVYQSSQELEASLVCFKDPPFPWGSAIMTGTFLSGVFYVYAKRDKIFKSKSKQF